MKTYSQKIWRRREFLKTFAATAASSVLPATAFTSILDAAPGLAQSAKPRIKHQSARNVNPMIGTSWRGHMFPGAVAPFGLVQLSPDTSGPPDPKWNIQGDWYEWQHCSGYHYTDNVVLGFSHTHIQGTGGIDLGDVLVMPMVEGKNWSWNPGKIEALTEMQIEALGVNSGLVLDPSELGYRSFFSHDRETAHAGYYSVHLETPGVDAELTATSRCGMHRYRYPSLPAKTKQGLMVDLAHGLHGKVYATELTIESTTRITGSRATHGWAHDRHVYFVLEISQPAASMEVSVDGKAVSANAGEHYSGEEIKVILHRAPNAEPLVVRVGISPTSIEGAKKNLIAEIPGWDFDAVVDGTAHQWNELLALVDAKSSDHALSEAFDTAVYHSMVDPATFNDVDGTYRGQDGQNHPNPGFTKYTTLSIWDIYRGEFPFIMLSQPHRANDIIETLLTDYRQMGQHSLPMWPLWANETWSMVGFHAAGMILGAYTRGFRGFNAENAYAAIRDTALVGSEAKSNKELQEMFRKYGYVPMDLHEGSVSCTLDLSYDYWCAGAMAELLGKHDDAAMFYKIGQNYKNVFNPETGFMQGKDKSGVWRTPFRPDQEYGDYVETDAWQSSFSVPHDVQGLIDLYGGDDAFVTKLEGLFTAPSFVIDARPDVTGMVGQDAQGDEPSNHNPYLFSFAGAPWKTQFWVRKVAALYNNTPTGIPGNDDCGQLSSWLAFAALGFYPVNAATGVYVIGSPMMDHATLRNPLTGSQFVITAENNSAENVYIQSVTLNGRKLKRSWLTHDEITTNGELRFRMDKIPNKQWGAEKSDRPPSGLLARHAV